MPQDQLMLRGNPIQPAHLRRQARRLAVRLRVDHVDLQPEPVEGGIAAGDASSVAPVEIGEEAALKTLSSHAKIKNACDRHRLLNYRVDGKIYVAGRGKERVQGKRKSKSDLRGATLVGL
jgi:hypothetical protein